MITVCLNVCYNDDGEDNLKYRVLMKENKM